MPVFRLFCLLKVVVVKVARKAARNKAYAAYYKYNAHKHRQSTHSHNDWFAEHCTRTKQADNAKENTPAPAFCAKLVQIYSSGYLSHTRCNKPYADYNGYKHAYNSCKFSRKHIGICHCKNYKSAEYQRHNAVCQNPACTHKYFLCCSIADDA